MKKPVIFLDRDGVLTKEKSYVLRKEELEIFDYASACVRKMHDAGYLVLVITNQSAVARGMMTEETLQEMNDILMEETGVDDVFYCPHWHPTDAVCDCRKPQTGMIQQAMQKYDLDMEHAYFVGDRASDIRTGQNAGIQTVLLESGYGTKRLEEEVTPDYIFEDLRDFVKNRL